MSVKKHLNNIKYLDQDIASREREKESLMATMLRSSKWAQNKVQESNSGHYDDKYVRILEMGKSIDEKIDRLADLKATISKEIDSIQSEDNRLKIILRDKYINLRSWKEIAFDLELSVDRIYRLHGDALKEYAKIYKP